MSGGLGAWPGNRSQNAHRAARCSVRWTGRRRGGSAKPSLRLGTFEHAADGLVCSCAGDGGTAPAQKGSSESSSHGFPNEFDNMLAKPADLTAGARGGPAHPLDRVVCGALSDRVVVDGRDMGTSPGPLMLSRHACRIHSEMPVNGSGPTRLRDGRPRRPEGRGAAVAARAPGGRGTEAAQPRCPVAPLSYPVVPASRLLRARCDCRTLHFIRKWLDFSRKPWKMSSAAVAVPAGGPPVLGCAAAEVTGRGQRRRGRSGRGLGLLELSTVTSLLGALRIKFGCEQK